ncbi:L-rhamnono-gamma-lactonase [Talaromyces pinophilus]|nr:L-rhamnono-gamma-lactonase [Talaromyces pinophilus]
MTIPIVDSHIHLWTETQLETLAWHNPNNPLGSQHSIEDYVSSAAAQETSKYQLQGFVYLEVDRISSVEEENDTKGWKHVLDEVSFLARIARGTPADGEGHVETHKSLMLGFVPWAPVPGGPVVLERYVSLVKGRIASSSSTNTEFSENDEVWKKFRGFRYLVQDKPAGTMLQPDFVEGLKWLGKQRLVFDLGVDARQGGLGQLREAVELIRRVNDGVSQEDRVVIIINHLCKPNLHILPDQASNHPDFLEWKDLITAMATHSTTTYMKLSGLFSEYPQQSEEITQGDEDSLIDCLVDHARPWTDAVFDAFGPHRVMFGSDWPVCTVGTGATASKSGGGRTGAWIRWRKVVERILERRGLSEDEKKDVWGGVAVRAYGLDIVP